MIKSAVYCCYCPLVKHNAVDHYCLLVKLSTTGNNEFSVGAA